MPRRKAWPLQRLIDWLNAHPIIGEGDITFIEEMIAARISAAESAAREKENEDRNLGSGGASWHGKFPMLRLIHALVDHDEIKSAFLMHHKLPGGHMAIEIRNTEEAHLGTVWQILADKWNDPNFLPVKGVLPDLSPDFAHPFAILYEFVHQMQVATAEKVEEKWNSINLQLKHAIENWERSDQGDGGYLIAEFDYENIDDLDDDELELGLLRNRPQGALNLHKNFFDGKSYLLYLWEMLDTHDLFHSSMQ